MVVLTLPGLIEIPVMGIPSTRPSEDRVASATISITSGGHFMPRGIYHRPSAEERFWKYVHKTDTCWLWTAHKNRKGYGGFGVNGRSGEAHRFSWVLHFGPIPDGLCVLHNCPGGDNPSCVRPDHLFLGTKADNCRDRHAKGRDACGDRSGPRIHRDQMPRGEQINTAKLTAVQVQEIRRRYAAGGINMTELAALYGVDKTNVRHIVRRLTWRHVP